LLEFSKQVEQLTVICLEEGEHDLPENVNVLSLGKEHNTSRIKRVLLLAKYVIGKRQDYDTVLVHMNPVYVVLFGWYWKLAKKPISLWYMHRCVDMKLRIAEKFVERIFTGSEHSLRLNTDKKIVTGHGIDTTYFLSDVSKKSNTPYVLTVGRISPAKQTMEIIRAMRDVLDAVLHIVGDAVTKIDKKYLVECKKFVEDNNLQERIIFHGAVPHNETRDFYQQATMFVNISKTGSLDKVLLEALACEAVVVTSNDAGKDVEGVHYFDESETPLVDMITANIHSTGYIRADHEYVEAEHGLKRLINKIVSQMKNENTN